MIYQHCKDNGGSKDYVKKQIEQAAQGTGKTIVGEMIGSLFRDHYRRVADPRNVTALLLLRF